MSEDLKARLRNPHWVESGTFRTLRSTSAVQDMVEAADEIERLEAENADLRSRTSSTLPAAVKAAASALIGRIDRGEPVRDFNACVEVVARWCLDERAVNLASPLWPA